MAELDPEVVARVARWCAEAGRQAGTAQIHAALAPLGWDELLAVKALLADPPPARPLGPFALADLARGVAPSVAAEREREGLYRRAEEEAAEAPAPAAAPAAPHPATPPSGGRRRRGKRPAPIVVRRARDRVPEAPPSPPPLPLVGELHRPEGRAELERLIRRHGGRRAALLGALAAGWRRADGAPLSDADLQALLDEHGLARAWARRERDEVLHALRAAGGVRAIAAQALGIDVPALDATLDRLGATTEADRIREDRRSELRARATLAERVQLLLRDETRLADLGLLEEFETDLRARLPEHVRALRAGGEPLRPALARTLALTPAAVDQLATRFALALEDAAPAARPRPASRPDDRRPARPDRRPALPADRRPARSGGRKPAAPGARRRTDRRPPPRGRR